MSDAALLAAFSLYGVLAGFVVVRLSRHRTRRGREWQALVLAGWFACALSLTLAAAFFGYAAYHALR